MKDEHKVKALAWYAEHKSHVDDLVKETQYIYGPSDEDAGSPELWKAAHWKWFLNLKNNL